MVPSLTRASFASGTYQSHITRAMRSHVRPGDVCFDLGAHVGYFALVLARLAGPAGHVYAFEPDPRNFEALTANTANTAHVTPVAAAVSDQPGEVVFATFEMSSIGHIADSKTPGDAHRVPVTCTTLDRFVYEDGNPAPAFIKIDVEGAETRVLEGAARLLREAQPAIVVEVRGPGRWSEVKEIAGKAGYVATMIGAGERGLGSAGYGDALLAPARRS